MYLLERFMVIVILSTAFSIVWAGEMVIYASPTGDDIGRGGGQTDAVATIQRAVDLAETAPPGTTRVKVIFLPGKYIAQRFEIAGNPNQVPILITSASGGRAVFDGNGRGGTWMTLRPNGGNPANVTIDSVEIRNYVTAINAQGDRNDPERWAGGMAILNNRFSHIGDIARSGSKPSTAAIRLVNSDNNVITRNEFIHIRNKKSCELLHAIYVAHGSMNNLIESNNFGDSCGDAVRFRDGSNNNVIRNNLFTDAWARSPISDWFCNRYKRRDCTKASGECPSLNNLLDGNRAISRELPPTEIFIPWGGVPPEECGSGTRAIIR